MKSTIRQQQKRWQLWPCGTSLGLLLLVLTNAVQAAGGNQEIGNATTAGSIHACRSAAGVTFQDRPCDQLLADEPTVTNTSRPPAGMDPSWLTPPEHAHFQASCRANGCECGPWLRAFQSGKAVAVADALYLDGQWHRYESLRYASTRASSSAERAELERALQEASCDVQMSQQIIRRFADEVLRTLRTRKRHAENRGHDDPAACESGLDPDACEGYATIQLNARLVEDLRALANARSVSATPSGTSGTNTP